MDLKIKDVAELLHVSEITIRRWLASGQIPAYRLNHQYRFSRLEIENWMMSCKLKTDKGIVAFEGSEDPSLKSGSRQFGLFRALHQGEVLLDIAGSTKEEVISASARRIAQVLGLDADLLRELLLDRENLTPTALNHGIAVPHPRELICKGAVDRVFLVFPSSPIEFGAMDGQLVHTLFFLFSSQDKSHLHLLAKIAHLASSAESQKFLSGKPTKEMLLAYIKTWESKMSA